MNWFTRYKQYIKDNPKNLWFKRRPFGYGWVPATWQGFAVVFGYLVTIIVLGFFFENGLLGSEQPAVFIVIILGLVSSLIYICYQKGERPRWSWGIENAKREKRKEE